MIVRLSDKAEKDLQEAFGFYESARIDLGRYFLRTVLKDLRRLETIAGIHAVFHGPYFRMLVANFPFAIFYRINDGEVFVDAILDMRRDPQYISSRMGTDL